jgi:hypothetical protein
MARMTKGSRALLVARWLGLAAVALVILLPGHHVKIAEFLLIPAVVLYAAPMVRFWKRHDFGDPLRKYLD